MSHNRTDSGYSSCYPPMLRHRSQCDLSLGNRGDELTPCYCSKCLPRLQHELIRELQHVIISRVNPGCSALTSRVQLTTVINYPLCRNRNSFLASYWSERIFFRILIGQYPHIKEQHIPTEIKIRWKIWQWKLAETNWIILNFTIEIKVADNNTTYIIHGVSLPSVLR